MLRWAESFIRLFMVVTGAASSPVWSTTCSGVKESQARCGLKKAVKPLWSIYLSLIRMMAGPPEAIPSRSCYPEINSGALARSVQTSCWIALQCNALWDSSQNLQRRQKDPTWSDDFNQPPSGGREYPRVSERSEQTRGSCQGNPEPAAAGRCFA